MKGADRPGVVGVDLCLKEHRYSGEVMLQPQFPSWRLRLWGSGVKRQFGRGVERQFDERGIERGGGRLFKGSFGRGCSKAVQRAALSPRGPRARHWSRCLSTYSTCGPGCVHSNPLVDHWTIGGQQSRSGNHRIGQRPRAVREHRAGTQGGNTGREHRAGCGGRAPLAELFERDLPVAVHGRVHGSTKGAAHAAHRRQLSRWSPPMS